MKNPQDTPSSNWWSWFKGPKYRKANQPQEEFPQDSEEEKSTQEGPEDPRHPIPISEAHFYDLLSFQNTFKAIDEAGRIDQSIFEERGFKDGLHLGSMQHGIERIAAVFEAGKLQEEALTNLFQGKIEAQQSRRAELLIEIQELQARLDKSDPKSEASQIYQQIDDWNQRLHREVEKFHGPISSGPDYQEILGRRVEEELGQVEKQRDHQDSLFREIKTNFEISAYKLRKDLETEALDIKKEELPLNKQARKVEEQRRKAKEDRHNRFQEKVFQASNMLHDLYEDATDSLKSQNTHLREWYNGIIEQMRRDLPATHSRLYIRVLGVFLIMILLGEVYLISEMTTKIFGIEPDGGAAGVAPTWVYTLWHYIFCFGYPVGLGMIVKYYLGQLKIRHKTPFRFIRRLVYVGVILIFSVAILNAFQLGSRTAATAMLPQNVSDLIQMPLSALSFLGVSIVFSFVAGLMFLDFFEAFERYKDTWGTSPLKRTPAKNRKSIQFEANQEQIKKTIEDLKSDLKSIKDELKQAKCELNKCEADIREVPENWNFETYLEQLKQAAINAYHTGFNRGLWKKQGNLDLKSLIENVRKNKVIQHIPFSDLNGSPN